jgi:hypothetical protein
LLRSSQYLLHVPRSSPQVFQYYASIKYSINLDVLKAMRNIFIILILSIAFPISVIAQPTQTLRGKVVDKESQMPLLGSNVIILEAGPITGVITNEEGIFSIDEIPVGRYNIMVSHMGYQSLIEREVVVGTGKEIFLNIGLSESVVEIKEVSVEAGISKDQTINPMAGISARSFTVEETERYAGSWGDPARMASNYAGVFTNGDIYNYIVIRGNSPNGLIWRMEGVPIPNPNHFDIPGATGGPVSILNPNQLTQSDFLTGAFPAEYSNGISGVFDLRLRNGNDQKRKYTAQLGMMGLEIGAEGPFSKKSRASYMINYRYSLLGLVDELLWVNALPYYQDLSFKVQIPLKKGALSAFGFGGASHISETFDDTISKSSNTSHQYTGLSEGKTGIVGLKYTHFISTRTRIVTNLAASTTRPLRRMDSLINNKVTRLIGEEKYSEERLLLSSRISTKFNARNTANLGIQLEDHIAEYIFNSESMIYNNPSGDSLVLLPPTKLKENNLFVIQTYLEWKHRFTNSLSLYTGLNYLHFFMNNSFSLEPRASISWRFSDKQTFSLGYGKHSQLQPFFYYFNRTPTTDDIWDRENYQETNRELDFTKSHHFALGYDLSITRDLRFKTEVFNQYLYDIPVETKESYISLINVGSGSQLPEIDSLVNEGTGRNYGIEFTLEKFLSNRYYFLVTTSLLNSKYRGSDGVLRNTAFDNTYNVNSLIGYELPIRDNAAFNFNIRFVSAGGRRVVPVNEAESILQDDNIYDTDRAFEVSLAPYARLDFRVNYKFNKPRATQEISLDLVNLTNRSNEWERFYNWETNEIVTRYQQGFFLYLLYRINF